MKDVLRFLLTEAPDSPALDSVEAWWRRHLAVLPRFPAPADLALASGFRADRLGFAFASGYHAALRSLFPQLPPDRRVALCATESGGGHPSAIETTLTPAGAGWKLDGAKTYVTLGTYAEVLLVVATEGRDAQGRNRLRMVMVDAKKPGVQVEPLPPLGFVPEVPHAALRLEGVTVGPEDVLPGDGYTRYLRPFRTVEDCHVNLAVLGWLVKVGRRCGWPVALREELVAIAVLMRALAQEDPSEPGVHVALGGAFTQLHRALERCETAWEGVDVETREKWQRDRRLLDLAGKVRVKRLESARQKLAGGTGDE
ncbi:acyl-CoA dehydrogenase [Corallococcus praedator]|uniref:Acyl-CoA dehydrogenase n=1 Tax=Corallococcus praedator TaxID=2316724 RepID=A0ABX9Q9P4_9BACT|nr:MULTISPECIES: acyl-CoA dehydrogenase family protein [Corallococcus]RKH24161.1 acyl-CoA dehydrogenase [Corallococcus sp. CA031C]RKH95485.1 acyl-CoA dehydrogenase [Corallococcus praedator]